MNSLKNIIFLGFKRESYHPYYSFYMSFFYNGVQFVICSSAAQVRGLWSKRHRLLGYVSLCGYMGMITS